MVEITVNGATLADRSPQQNWGELLECLENGKGLSQPTVTAVRFDGVDVPTFRSRETLGRELGDLDSIDIDLSTRGELLHESARAAHQSVAPLRRAVRRIAVALRRRDLRTADRDLAELMGALRILTTLTALLTTEGAPGSRADLDALAVKLCGMLDTLVDRQAQGECGAVADVLDRELRPAMDQWASILLAVQADIGRGTSSLRFASIPFPVAPLTSEIAS